VPPAIHAGWAAMHEFVGLAASIAVTLSWNYLSFGC